ncbi:hypothetical protein [Embleya hyalina]|uniref:Uncharacterized protein n=1 Tax=Embleya hyalina TaxID=516124 RepID=A0A401Z3Z1_9ACTN|nr:hypothetical protein [Embleya hyalina]GCE01558.1 hypothetical protein EHYA_09324 [Embleya hyalina]
MNLHLVTIAAAGPAEGVPAQTPNGVTVNGTVTMSMGVLFLLLGAWAWKSNKHNAGLALLMTASVLLGSGAIGRLVAQLGSQLGTSAVQAANDVVA